MTAGLQLEDDAPQASSTSPSAASLSLCYTLADQDFQHTKSVGIFNLSLGLLGALARQGQVGRLHVLSNRVVAGFLPRDPRWTVSEHNGALRGKWGRVWWDQVALARAARRSGCAWTYLPKGYAPWWVRLPGRVACYVHDTIQVFYREHYPLAFSALDRVYFTRALCATLRQARVIFTNSEFSRRELLRLAAATRLPTPPTVVAGIGFELPPVPRGVPGDDIICLASRWPHKRTDLAVRYLERWQGQTRHAGAVHWIGKVPARIAWPSCSNWRRHERLDHAAYQRLLTTSRALVYFSEYEGFGMPPVEAVLRGTCPVYSRVPGTTEVMAGLGQPFDNGDYESFRRALDEALRTPPAVLTAWADVLRARFTWEGVAARVVQGLLAHGAAREKP